MSWNLTGEVEQDEKNSSLYRYELKEGRHTIVGYTRAKNKEEAKKNIETLHEAWQKRIIFRE